MCIESSSYKWEIIENIGGESTLPSKLKKQKFYSAPFFTTQEGEEVGLSHLFYVKLLKKSDIETLEKMAIENSVKIIGKNKFMPFWYTLSCNNSSAGNALEMANLFYESGKFSAAEPDLMVDDSPRCVNDDNFSYQWNLDNTGQNGGTSGVDIQFCNAWEVASDCNDIVVAVVDKGIEMNHPDLSNMFSLSYDTESGTQPSQVLGSHGTACAGIIGASANNSEGISGIASNCQLMSVSNSLSATPNSRQKRGDGINWAWQNGADVISNSWVSALQCEIIDDAINNALTQGRNGLGCVVLFAAGNQNSTVEYPANSNPDIIAVGAMSPCGERKSPNSCDGENWGSNYGSTLDVIAPGVFIPTTDLQGSSGYNISSGTDGDYYLSFNGTSAATPHVAGVAALILSVNPDLTQDEVRDIIESTCTKVGNYTYTTTSGRNNGTWDNEVGYGCINACDALLEVIDQMNLLISGPTIVCSTGASFTVNNLPSGTTVTWNKSTKLVRLSAQGANPCVFAASSSGEGWIQATINSSCGSITLPKKNIWAGRPRFTITGTQELYPKALGFAALCEYGTDNPIMVGGDNDPGITNVQWSYSGPLDYITGETGINYRAKYAAGLTSGQGLIYADASNACGSVENNMYYSVEGWLRLFPNPTEGTLYVEIDGTQFDKLPDNNRCTLTIFDKQMHLRKSKRFTGYSTSVDVNHLPSDVYIVRVKAGEKTIETKIMVK